MEISLEIINHFPHHFVVISQAGVKLGCDASCFSSLIQTEKKYPLTAKELDFE